MRTEASHGVHGVECRHIFVRYDEAEDIGVFANARGRYCLGQGQRFVLQTPTYENLCLGFAVFFGDCFQDGIAESATAAQRCPRLHDYSVGAGEFGGFRLVRVGETEVIFYLIDHRFDLAFTEKDVEMFFQAVTNPDCAHFAVGVKFFQSTPGLRERARIIGGVVLCNGPMDKVKVEVVQPEFAHRFVEGAQSVA